jgi:hypothetical protein
MHPSLHYLIAGSQALLAAALLGVNLTAQWQAVSNWAIDHHAIAFDRDDDRLLRLGGIAPRGEVVGLWEHRISVPGWRIVGGDHPRLHSHGLVIVPSLPTANRPRRILAVGGMVAAPGGMQPNLVCHLYDGATWTTLPAPAPGTTLMKPQLCHDPVRDRVVAFLAHDGSTWEWDPTTLSWALANLPPPPGATGLAAFRIAFSSATNRATLVRASDPIHIFGLTTGGWVQELLWPSNSAHSGRSVGTAPLGLGVFLFGGYNGAGVYNNDPLIWNGSNFQFGGVFSASLRERPDLVLDTNRDRLCLLGGYNQDYNDGNPNNAFVWGASAAGPYPEASLPGYLWAPTMVATQGDRVLLHANGQTWRFVDDNWVSVTTGPAGNVAFDELRQVAVLQAGAATYELVNDAWVLKGTAPLNLNSSALTYDPLQAAVVAIQPLGSGGQLLQWNGSSWTSIATATFPPSSSPWQALVFDRARAQLVCIDSTLGLWRWTGNDWQFTNAVAPGFPGSGGFTASYDPLRERVVLWTTTSSFEWDGATWTQLPIPSTQAFASVNRAAATYSPTHEANLVFWGDRWWQLRSANPPRSETFGAGCGSQLHGTPVLRQRGQGPWLDDTLRQDVLHDPATTPLLGVLGFRADVWGAIPLPLALVDLGMPQCLLHQEPFHWDTSLAPWALSIPNQAQLIGLEFYTQVLVQDAAAAGGAVMTNTLLHRIGRR